MQPIVRKNIGEDSPALYRLICRIIWRLSPKYTLYGTEKLPAEPCVLVGNHAQMYGPIASELYLPRAHYIWCVGEMMDRKEVPAYAYKDFWSMKPKAVRWFYRLLSYAIARLSEYVFNHAHTIPVRHDVRVMTTIRRSMEKLQEGADIVIFPEKNEPYNSILCAFQENFTDLARLYYRKTGKVLSFVPMYTAPALSSVHFGEPVRYDPEAPAEEERKRVCGALARAITGMAIMLPRHVVVPYVNMPKKEYPLNTDRM